ncbi:MAG: 2-C-methyl-D-erythritol 4-phosphate cytidylyltransferase [Planctomycetes bacterium]|nr:2-C-methyl-D-erythritol 4-phosphate cytidylyltransferase [Planctomycetota bacterium]
MAKVGLVIVAGGQGTRMGGEVPKPFIKLRGREVILHTLDAFRDIDAIRERVLVLPKSIIKELFGPEKQRNFPSSNHAHALVRAFAELGVSECVCGGERRQDSVLRGAQAMSEQCETLLVHDAVRPFVKRADIEAVVTSAQAGNATSVATPITDTLRQREGGQVVDRDSLVAMQTPQGGPKQALISILEGAQDTLFTDDVAAFLQAGLPLSLVMGHKSNIKLTTPEDLAFAEFLLKEREAGTNA